MADIFRGKIIDVTHNSYVVEMTGQSSKLDSFIQVFPENSIIEVVRSGRPAYPEAKKAYTSNH